ncbi:bifunctional riboflavin kinase/FAD synthetase [Chloroflexota bacterium]
MQVEKELAELSPDKDAMLTIGVFDGVHLGHQYLLSQLKKHAREKNLLSGVVTFSHHPRAIMLPQTRLPFLTDLNQRIELLKNEGIEVVVVLSFTPELARLSPHRFVSLLREHLRMQGLVIGHDFALGQNRKGDTDTLRALGREMNFSVTVIPPKKINGEVVSSTAIRQALTHGDMKRVHRLIGRCFSLHGPVITGNHRGVELGFPTANLKVDSEQALPADGVYATRVYIDGKAYKSMTNIGLNPTFGCNERTIEVYVLDYHRDLYGQELKIDIIDRVRDEKRFDTARQLEEQIAEDIKQGEAILSRHGRD